MVVVKVRIMRNNLEVYVNDSSDNEEKMDARAPRISESLLNIRTQRLGNAL